MVRDILKPEALRDSAGTIALYFQSDVRNSVHLSVSLQRSRHRPGDQSGPVRSSHPPDPSRSKHSNIYCKSDFSL